MLIAPALRICTAALAACLLFPALAAAADGERTPLNIDASEPARTAATGGGAGAGLVRTIVGLAIVLAVIYGLHWVLKQVKASREERVSGDALGTLATLPLGPNRALHLVRAGNEVVLLGVGEGGVTPVRTYSETEARALGLLGDPTEATGAQHDPVPVAALATSPEALAALGAPGAVAAAPAARSGVSSLMAELRRRTVR